jgi:hypothetical protein
MSIFLRVRKLQDSSKAPSRRLLCVLFIRFREVSSDAEGAFVLLICKKDRLLETQALPNEGGSHLRHSLKEKADLDFLV